MSVKKRKDLYNLFVTGNKPTQDDFADLIDSAVNIAEDGLGVETGKPLEVVEQGEVNKKRYLDFSSSKNNPVWRVGAQSSNGARSGLNVTTVDDHSRLFINKENGFLGINNDNPAAMLDIAPGGGNALRVADLNQNSSLLIGANGKIGLGMDPQENYTLSVGGKANFKNEVVIDAPVTAEKGITVKGEKLFTEQGLSVENGATLDGTVETKAGLTVGGKVLTANAGAIVNGSTLEARQGLTVNHGAVIETGELLVKAGANISGAALEVENGLKVSQGAVIETGQLEALAGLAVSGAALEVGNGLTVQGATVFKGDTVVETGLLTAKGGIAVSDGSGFSAAGPVVLGNGANGIVEVNGLVNANEGMNVAKSLVAKAGVVVSGAGLIANDGLSVKNGLTVETGLVTVQGGLSLTAESPLTAAGPVVLGSDAEGKDVTINGALQATKGAIISGAELVAANGASITGKLTVSDAALFSKATVDSLQVNDITINGNFGLTTVDLKYLSAKQAEVGSLKTTGELEIAGLCQTADNVIFNTGMIYASYEGKAGLEPRLEVVQGTVSDTEKGHFGISVDAEQRLTVVFNAESDIDNLMADWKAYQLAQPGLTAGFDLIRLGNSSWDIREQEVGLSPVGVYQEYVATANGLRVLYTSTSNTVSQLEITVNENSAATRFEFEVSGANLTINCPVNQEYCTVNALIDDWRMWLNENWEFTGGFEIRKTTDATGELTVTALAKTALTENAAGAVLSKAIIKTNIVTVNAPLKFDGSDLLIGGVSDSASFAENSPSLLPTQKAVKSYVDNGLALKANSTTMTSELSKKADAATMSSALAKKADAETMVTALSAKAGLVPAKDLALAVGATGAVSAVTLTTDSRGILMVRITTASGKDTAGLFALHGASSILKIAGDGMATQKDNSGTCNLYLAAGVITIQNATTEAITATASYFGV